jgi:ribonuclease Z
MKANVKQLILGHYSTRYENIKLLKKKLKLFSRSLLADDGKSFDCNLKLKQFKEKKR